MTRRDHFATRLAAGAALLLAAAAALAAARPTVNTSRGNLAMRGYDAVSYWNGAQPVKGSAAHEFSWRGATWRFATAAHRERFVREPERYAPQFGGYCAYAVGNGYLADGDPEVWRIVDGQLFLNYSKRAQRLWEADIPGFIAKGRQAWPKVLDK